MKPSFLIFFCLFPFSIFAQISQHRLIRERRVARQTIFHFEENRSFKQVVYTDRQGNSVISEEYDSINASLPGVQFRHRYKYDAEGQIIAQYESIYHNREGHNVLKETVPEYLNYRYAKKINGDTVHLTVHTQDGISHFEKEIRMRTGRNGFNEPYLIVKTYNYDRDTILNGCSIQDYNVVGESIEVQLRDQQGNLSYHGSWKKNDRGYNFSTWIWDRSYGITEHYYYYYSYDEHGRASSVIKKDARKQFLSQSTYTYYSNGLIREIETVSGTGTRHRQYNRYDYYSWSESFLRKIPTILLQPLVTLFGVNQ